MKVLDWGERPVKSLPYTIFGLVQAFLALFVGEAETGAEVEPLTMIAN